MAPAVREVGELYEALAEDQGFTLEVRAPDGIVVDANRELIGQALANLVDNALKYGAAAERRPGPDRHRRPGASDVSARLAVSDGGPGIPEAERGHVLAASSGWSNPGRSRDSGSVSASSTRWCDSTGAA